METVAIQSTRDFLKSVTAECHKEIEGQIGLTEKIKSIQDYSHLLQKYYAFYFALEPKLDKFADQYPNDLQWPLRKKISLLTKDLIYLGFNPEDLNLGTPKTPSIRSIASAYGVMYVLEGSTLGGQLLKKHFHEKLNILPEMGGSFFNAYGPQTGKMWQSFVSVLDREVTTEPARKQAADIAKQTFVKLGAWVSI